MMYKPCPKCGFPMRKCHCKRKEVRDDVLNDLRKDLVKEGGDDVEDT